MNQQTAPWLITGAAGFLGSHLTERLVRQGIPVIAVDDLSTGKAQFLESFSSSSRFTFLQLDIRDYKKLEALCIEQRPSTLVHLAALHFIPAAVADPCRTVSINVHGTQSVLSAARAAGVDRFWFASTGDVYGPADSPHSESAEIRPFNIYGLTKWMGEELIRLESTIRPTAKFVIGRLFNLYGSRETNPHIIPEIINQLRQKESHSLLLGNTWPKRDLVPVSDAAKAIVETTKLADPGITVMNIATGVAHSIDETVEAISGLMGREIVVETDPSRLRAVERPHLQADVAKLKQVLGWLPNASLSSGLLQLLRAEGLCS